jgi:hypothetical protein
MRRARSSRGRNSQEGGRTHAALGFRAHSGWAALVMIAGPLRSPAVIGRQRIELVDPAIPEARQPYHAATGLDLREAEKLVKRCADKAESLACQALRGVIDDLRKNGHEVVGCGILLASGRPTATLAATLASHAMIHTAEGEHFRNAIRAASKHHNLPVTGVKERELFARGSAELRIFADDLERRVSEMGRLIGPPWAQDQKHAALVGWLALARASKQS